MLFCCAGRTTMDKQGLEEALGFLKRAIFFSKLLKAVSVVEKTIVIGVAALTLSEALMIIKRLNK